MIVIAAGGAAIALSSGSGGSARYVPPGLGIASTITPAPATASAAQTAAGSGQGGAPAFRPAPAATRAAAGLSLAQQVAQLFLVSVDAAAPASSLGQPAWGGIVLDSSDFASDQQVSGLGAAAVSHLRSAGPVAPLVAAIQPGGTINAVHDMPPASEASIGATANPAVAYSEALASGRALKRLGIELTVAPYVDVDNIGGALSGELYSTDPSAVGRFALAALRGYEAAGVIAAPAHFPGEGGASADPDVMTATVGGSLAALRARDLIPFAAIAARAPVIVMSNASYVAFDGVTPASLLPAAVRLLRDSLGFGGVVMSDDLDATLNATGETPGAVALAALRAGDDLLYISGPPSEHTAAYEAVLAAASHSAADRALVRQALLRDLTLKARFGLL